MTNYKKIPIAPDYLINEYGNIKSLKKSPPKDIKTHLEKSGYRVVALRVNGKYLCKRIHQLVAITFIDNPNNYPQINHINCDKGNNHVSNLEWCTSKHNINHAFKNNLVGRKKGEESHMYGKGRYVLNIQNGVYHNTIKEAAITYGYKRTTLNAMLKGRSKNTTLLIYA